MQAVDIQMDKKDVSFVLNFSTGKAIGVPVADTD